MVVEKEEIAEQLKIKKFRLLNLQCPKHIQSPYVDLRDGVLTYECCCNELKHLCCHVINEENRKKSN